MPNLPITGLPVAAALTGTELFPIAQGGVTRKETLNNISSFINNTGILFEKVTLVPAEIKTAFSVPLDTGIVLPGAGKVIRVLSYDFNFTGGVVPYDSNHLYLITDTATQAQVGQSGSYLQSGTGVNTFGAGGTSNVVDASKQLVANKGLFIKADMDSTTDGDAGITIYINYIIFTL